YLCGPRRRGASVGDRLSRRRAMDRGRGSKGVVRAGEVSPVLPSATQRMAGRRAGVADLCGSRFLNAPELKAALTREARALGFDSIGIAAPEAIAEVAPRFREFVQAGAHGEMDWLARNPERRTDPAALWPDVVSVIMFGVNYGPDQDPLEILKQRT